MHETAVAESIIRTIIEQAEKVNATPIRAVVSCGQFNALNDEAMQFAFEVASEDTVCKETKLEIKYIPLRATCKSCKHEFNFDVYSPKCPKCESSECDFLPDAPLLLEEIEFTEPE
mgnify:CR=1 FL=1